MMPGDVGLIGVEIDMANYREKDETRVAGEAYLVNRRPAQRIKVSNRPW